MDIVCKPGYMFLGKTVTEVGELNWYMADPG